MGRPVVYRELACRSCGARHCRILGRPLEAWDEAPEGFEFLAEASASARASADAPVDHAGPEVPASAPARAGLVGVDPTFLAAWSLVEAVAPTRAPALIHGEVGSGRSTLAAAIHRLGGDAAGPLVTIGAGHLGVADVDDALARAAGGTLVVDELDAWPEASRRRLLERLGEPFGGGPRLVITVGAAPEDPALDPLTRRILLRSGAFAIHAPPLRERPRDLLPLAHTFLKRQEAILGKALAGFTRRARRALEAHAYAGNLHELAGLVARGAILGEAGAPVDVGHLFGGDPQPSAALRLDGGQLRPEAGAAAAAAASEAPLPPVDLDALAREALDRGVALDDHEEALIRSAVDRAEGNLAAAARTLGLTRPQLAYRFRKLGDEGG